MFRMCVANCDKICTDGFPVTLQAPHFISSFLMCTIGSDSSEFIVQLLVCPCKNLVGQDDYDQENGRHMEDYFFPTIRERKEFRRRRGSNCSADGFPLYYDRHVGKRM